MSGYVAVGHGRRGSGVFDPGACSEDAQEHTLAHAVAAAAFSGLARSGVSFTGEVNPPGGEDPDYEGSVARINAGGYDWAIEIHFDCARAPGGGFGLYASDDGKAIASAIRETWKAVGLTARDNTLRTGLYFLNATTCPAIIWECDPVQKEAREKLETMGEAIAAGLCDYLGMTYQPPAGRQPDRTSVVVALLPTPSGRGYTIVRSNGETVDFGDAQCGEGGSRWSLQGKELVAPVVDGKTTRDGGGLILCAADGGVFTFGNAPFKGSLAGKALSGPVVGVSLTPDEQGYWLTAADGGVFAFGTASFFGSDVASGP